MINRFILIILIFNGPLLIACDCKQFTQNYEESISDLIFIGKITEVNQDYYRVEVLELFKESLSNKDAVFKVKFDDCSINPMHDEIWLMFGQFEGGNLKVSSCGYSKNLSFFNQNVSSKILPPKPLKYTPEEEEIINSLHNSKVADQLYFTLSDLRMKKIEELIKDSTSNNLQTESQTNNNLEIYIFALVGFNSILVIFILLKLRRIS